MVKEVNTMDERQQAPRDGRADRPARKLDKNTITLFLIEQNLSPQYKGFIFLRDVLLHTTQDPSGLSSMTAVYNAVARENSTTYECVEHNIRYLMEMWCAQKDHPHWKRPQNKRVIALLTLHLLMGNEGPIKL